MATGAGAAEIGVFGGSGFYSLFDDVREVKVDTPYGPPSDSFFLAGRRTIASRSSPTRPASHDPAAPDQLPGECVGDALARREGSHLAMRRRVAPVAVKPGDFVVCDQFVDRTSGRPTPSTTARS